MVIRANGYKYITAKFADQIHLICKYLFTVTQYVLHSDLTYIFFKNFYFNIFLNISE